MTAEEAASAANGIWREILMELPKLELNIKTFYFHSYKFKKIIVLDYILQKYALINKYVSIFCENFSLCTGSWTKDRHC